MLFLLKVRGIHVIYFFSVMGKTWLDVMWLKGACCWGMVFRVKIEKLMRSRFFVFFFFAWLMKKRGDGCPLPLDFSSLCSNSLAFLSSWMHNVCRDIGDHFLGRYVDFLWSLEGLNAKTSCFLKNKNNTIPRFPSKAKLFPIPCAIGALCQLPRRSPKYWNFSSAGSPGSKENYTSTKNVKPTFWSLV